MPRNKNQATPIVIDAREKAEKALELRKTGMSYRQIAEKLKYNCFQTAYAAVKAALERVTKEPAEEVLKLELERLDALHHGYFMKAIEGDGRAAALCLQIADRRARMLGLDAPVKQEVKNTYESLIEKISRGEQNGSE